MICRTVRRRRDQRRFALSTAGGAPQQRCPLAVPDGELEPNEQLGWLDHVDMGCSRCREERKERHACRKVVLL